MHKATEYKKKDGYKPTPINMMMRQFICRIKNS